MVYKNLSIERSETTITSIVPCGVRNYNQQYIRRIESSYGEMILILRMVVSIWEKPDSNELIKQISYYFIPFINR
jgi:hypothetical protein